MITLRAVHALPNYKALKQTEFRGGNSQTGLRFAGQEDNKQTSLFDKEKGLALKASSLKKYTNKAFLAFLAMVGLGGGVVTYKANDYKQELAAANNSFTARMEKEHNFFNENTNHFSQKLTTLASRNDDFAGFLENFSQELEKIKEEAQNRIGLEAIPEAVAKVAKSTLQVKGTRGTGSGSVIELNGKWYLLSNSHVTEGNAISGGSPEGHYQINMYNGNDFEKPYTFNAPIVRLTNGKKAESSSKNNDLVLLEIPSDALNELKKQGIQPIAFRDTDQEALKVGETVIAIGNPFGLRDSVSRGVISHLKRIFDTEPENVFIQTDAPINPGNSGGVLIDLEGRIVGINTLKAENADGIGGSIHINTVKDVLSKWTPFLK